MRAIAAGLLGMALSTSSAFASGLCTTTGFADVTGDGKADAISVSRSFWSERTFVWRSSGTAFQSRETWTSTRRRAAFGTAATYSFADVDGDKKADAIYITATGISVRISDGTQFGNPASWSTEPIASDQRVFVADATGDGKADIILVSWTRPLRVRVSDGTQFLPETDWGQLRPPDQPSGAYILAGDITGDKRADILAYGLYKDNPPSSGFHSEQMLRRVQTAGWRIDGTGRHSGSGLSAVGNARSARQVPGLGLRSRRKDRGGA